MGTSPAFQVHWSIRSCNSFIQFSLLPVPRSNLSLIMGTFSKFSYSQLSLVRECRLYSNFKCTCIAVTEKYYNQTHCAHTRKNKCNNPAMLNAIHCHGVNIRKTLMKGWQLKRPLHLWTATRRSPSRLLCTQAMRTREPRCFSVYYWYPQFLAGKLDLRKVFASRFQYLFHKLSKAKFMRAGDANYKNTKSCLMHWYHMVL